MDLISKTVKRASLLALALLLPSIGQSADLLRTVDRGVVDSFTAAESYPLQYGLRSQLYRAKKYRIVQINFDLLDQPNTEFTITLWAGVTVQVKALDTAAPGSYEGMRSWMGEMMNASVMGGSDPLAVNLTVYNNEWTMPVKQVRRMQIEKRRAPLTGPTAGKANMSIPNDAMIKMKFKTVMGRIYVPQIGATIVIQPIEDDPRYHVVVEEDPDTVVYGVDWNTPSAGTDDSKGVKSPDATKSSDAERYKRLRDLERKVAEERIRDLGR